MKAEELRIGNLLMYTGQTVYVLGIHQAATLGKSHTIDLGYYTDSVGFERHENDELLSGIPLSPEWLERFSIPTEFTNKYIIDFLIMEPNKSYGLWVNMNSDAIDPYLCDLLYVHSLQNTYFILTGKELELKQ